MPLLELLYFFSTVLLAVYGLYALSHTLTVWWLGRGIAADIERGPDTSARALPLVTVQLPVYNERHVVNRLIRAATSLDWPVERLQIQVLDDSAEKHAKGVLATFPSR